MAKNIDSESCDQPGILSKIDRLCRRILPGYNYIRNRRSGSRVSLEARKVCSRFLIPTKFRGNKNKKRSSNEITDEIYLGAGISKSEFCKTLEELLRKKLIVMQERMKQDDFEEFSWEADQKQDNVVVAHSKEEKKEDDDDDGDDGDIDDESLAKCPLVSPEVRQRMIQAMLHQSGQDTPDMDTPQAIAGQETYEDEPRSSHIKQWEPSDDFQLEDIKEEPEPESDAELSPSPNSLVDYFLS